ncbi:MAG TPA: DUF2787 family protein, partial [Methylobacter sp.]
MIIQKVGYPLSISDQLVLILTHEIEQHSEGDISSGCIINFRDPAFSAESAGYHPVEIRLNKLGRVQYIANFAYVGDGHEDELVKELDFNFDYCKFQHRGREYPISLCAELFNVWQSNFCAYYLCKVFNVTIQAIANCQHQQRPCQLVG